MNKTAQSPLQATVVNDDEALLLQFGFADLPHMFAMQTPDGLIQEKSPCYRCSADGFYGHGKEGTWYEEGSIIVMDSTPNQHTEPLNRAAGTKWAKWAQSLPAHKAAIDVGDMSEAAHMLAKDPRVTELGPVEYQEAVVKLAVSLKLKREGKDARSLPSMGHNFAPQSGGNAPPVLNAKLSDMTQRGPGSLHAPGPREQAGVRRAAAPANTSAGNVMGGPPPR